MHSTLSPLVAVLILIVLISGLGGMMVAAKVVRVKLMELTDDQISWLGVPTTFIRIFARILTGAFMIFCLVLLVGIFGITIILVFSH